MAYTTFQKSFWSDDYILNLNRTDKLVYCYLITNDKTQQCGIYELAMAKACLELDMKPEELLLSLKRFSDDKKICYSMETQEVCVVNWLKHNSNSSWKTIESVKKQLLNIKNLELMLILYDPREPLYDGTRKEKGDDGRYIEKPFVIENPLKEYFGELTDEELLEIRSPFFERKIRNMPLGSPLHGAFTNNRTVQNITYTEQYNNKTKTVSQGDDCNKQPFEQYIPPEERKKSKSSILDEVLGYWSSKPGLKEARKLTVNLGEKAAPLLQSISVYTLDEIKQAIDNYHTIQNNPDKYKPIATYGDVFGFINTGIDKYWGELKSLDYMKIEKGMSEAEKIAEMFKQRDRERAEQENGV